MCSQILHLMAALYRRIQILLPSLVKFWMVTQERGMIPLCAPWMSKEALVVVLRRFQVRNHCPGVGFFVVLESEFSTPNIVHISGHKA